MLPQTHLLRDGRELLIREAAPEDAPAVLEYIHAISGESDFLSFGPGEFELGEAEEAEALRKFRDTENHLYLLGLVGGSIVSSLGFSAGHRPRLRHSGGFGMSVRKPYWGLGIGSCMLDTLLAWARATRVITKIDLRVRVDNRRAIRLYESRGFVREGTLRKEIFLDGQYYDLYFMGLEL
jgi:RimJ/RimL family protein N-acetyltransferase